MVNNTETLANIPFIAPHGAEAYAALSPDTETNGSKLVCFNERFARPSVYEVPFGMTMRELCEDVAGGLRDGRTIKAVQIGGPLGGILPASKLDTAFDFDALAAEGCMVGHGRSSRLMIRPTCGRWPCTCCGSARTRAAASASRAGSGCGAPMTVRRRRAGRPRELRAAAGDARARQPVRPRRRHARADAQPARALPRRAGARMMHASRSTAPRSRSRRARRSWSAATGRRSWVPTLCFDERQAPFGACRVCLVGGGGRAQPLPACTTPCRDGMEIDTPMSAARRVAGAVVELVLSELPEAPAPHTELAQVAERLEVSASRPMARRHPRRRPRRAPSLPRLPARAVHLVRTLRARLRRGPGRVRAHRHRPGL